MSLIPCLLAIAHRARAACGTVDAQHLDRNLLCRDGRITVAPQGYRGAVAAQAYLELPTCDLSLALELSCLMLDDERLGTLRRRRAVVGLVNRPGAAPVPRGQAELRAALNQTPSCRRSRAASAQNHRRRAPACSRRRPTSLGSRTHPHGSDPASAPPPPPPLRRRAC